jgi:hypothetical protein
MRPPSTTRVRSASSSASSTSWVTSNAAKPCSARRRLNSACIFSRVSASSAPNGSSSSSRSGSRTRARATATRLLAEAGRAVDRAREDLTDDSAAAASIAVATAKAYADGAAVELASAVFEVSGTRSSLDSLNLHRHWRNARTHTLHDPGRWKVQHIGRYVLNGTRPARHGLL